jgi:hypothetical protein
MSTVSRQTVTPPAAHRIGASAPLAAQHTPGHLGAYSITPAEPGPAWASRYRPTNDQPANDGLPPPPAEPAQ